MTKLTIAQYKEKLSKGFKSLGYHNNIKTLIKDLNSFNPTQEILIDNWKYNATFRSKDIILNNISKPDELNIYESLCTGDKYYSIIINDIEVLIHDYNNSNTISLKAINQ